MKNCVIKKKELRDISPSVNTKWNTFKVCSKVFSSLYTTFLINIDRISYLSGKKIPSIGHYRSTYSTKGDSYRTLLCGSYNKLPPSRISLSLSLPVLTPATPPPPHYLSLVLLLLFFSSNGARRADRSIRHSLSHCRDTSAALLQISKGEDMNLCGCVLYYKPPFKQCPKYAPSTKKPEAGRSLPRALSFSLSLCPSLPHRISRPGPQGNCWGAVHTNCCNTLYFIWMCNKINTHSYNERVIVTIE